VKLHENSKFLYQCSNSNAILRERVSDYCIVYAVGTALVGLKSSIVFAPLVFFASFSFITHMRNLYFVISAELLPHTE